MECLVNNEKSFFVTWTIASFAALTGCSSDASTGIVQIDLGAEDTITEGLSAGTGDEDVVDGWSVDFDAYIIVVGGVRLAGGADDAEHSERRLVIDLTQLPPSGMALARFERVQAGLWPEVSFETPAASEDVERDESVTQAQFDRMVAEQCTYLVSGTLTNPGGQRCIRGDSSSCEPATSIGFDLCVPAATVYGPCESDTGIEGLAVVAGATTSANFTIHGDHLFFNGFPSGAEGSVARRAQWLANADLDANGMVTRAELEAIGPSDLGAMFPSTVSDGFPGFSLGNSPITIDTAWDYVVAQLKTQGHFQGEGECGIDSAE
jgi:hypothetical protein